MTLPGERAYGEMVSPPKALEKAYTQAHTWESSLNPEGHGSPQGVDVLQAPYPVQARTGK